MTEERVDLALEGVGDVDPAVRFERSRQVHGGYPVHVEALGAVLGEVVRVPGGRKHRVERCESRDAMVAVVEVRIAEEDRGRVGAHHHLGAQLADRSHDRGAELLVVVELAVAVVEVEVTGEPELHGGRFGLRDPASGERIEIGVGVVRTLLAAW